MAWVRRLGLGVVLVAWAAGGFAACGSDDGGGVANNGGSGGGAGDAGSDVSASGTGGGISIDSGPSCTEGEPCDGGVCAGGQCCAAAKACGGQCCTGADVCSFQKCVTPGATCIDSSDCAAGEYCETALGDKPDAGGPTDAGCVGGKVFLTGRCLPQPPICAEADAGADAGAGQSCLDKCEVKPTTVAFDPEVKYTWGGQTASPYDTDVMMQPIVVQLDDDNCDGKVGADDIPEIVFSTFSNGYYYRAGTLHAVSVKNGVLTDKWSKPGVVQASTGLAAGDLDGDGTPEIVGCSAPTTSGGTSCCDAVAQNTGVTAFKADGSVLWTQPDTSQVHCGYEAPAIADPNGSGTPLVLVGLTLLNGKTGAVVKNLDPAHTFGVKLTGFSDVDSDGKLDVVEGRRAFRVDGTVIWDLSQGANVLPTGYHAVGDLDKDGKPEVVIISSSGPHTLSVIQYDPASPDGAKVIRKGIDINNGMSTATFCSAASEYGGGPPTVADFNGDGFPDVGAAGAVGYIVLDGKKLMDANLANSATTLWFKTTQDCSSAVTGSSVFDFNGDGKAEVVYGDEVHLWMYDGTTGTQLIPETCNTSGTLWEYPVIADVDNDGQADIVMASNAYGLTCNGTKQAGIRVLSSKSGSWVRTRRVWNQHTYHVTNVEENGAIPIKELTNWTVPGLNNFRQNKQPGGEFAAPDAVVGVIPNCGASYGIIATVRNIGQAVLPPGATVTFYAGTPPGGTQLGQGSTTIALGPAQAESVLLDLPNAPPAVKNGSTPVYATVAVAPPTVECRSDNNTSMEASGACGGPR
ncbi:MAG: VCBS repeat-containing protein [Polyangiaceae bacterium]